MQPSFILALAAVFVQKQVLDKKSPLFVNHFEHLTAKRIANIDELQIKLVKAFKKRVPSTVAVDISTTNYPIQANQILKYKVTTDKGPIEVEKFVRSYFDYINETPIPELSGFPLIRCPRTLIGNFTFPQTTINMASISEEKCENDSSRSKARIRCKEKLQLEESVVNGQTIFVRKIAVEEKTLVILKCDATAKSILDEFKNETVTTESLEVLADTLAAISAHHQNKTTTPNSTETERSNLKIVSSQLDVIIKAVSSNNVKVSESLLQATVSIASTLNTIPISNSSTNSSTNSSPNSSSNSSIIREEKDKVINTIVEFASKVQLSSKKKNIEVVTPQLNVKVELGDRNTSSFTYSPRSKDPSSNNLYALNITLNVGADHDTYRAVFVYFTSTQLFDSTQPMQVISGKLVYNGDVRRSLRSLSGGSNTSESIEKHIPLTNVKIQHISQKKKYGKVKMNSSYLTTEYVREQCVFWNIRTNSWSQEGCCLSDKETPPTCECSHTTNFALIVATTDVPNDLALSIFSQIGLGISFIAIMLTTILHIYHKSLRQKEWTKIQLNIYVNFLVAYLLFIFGVTRVENIFWCNTITMLLQFFFLSAWLWLAVYANKLYTSIVKIFSDHIRHYFLKACIFAYGIPFLVVTFQSSILMVVYDKELQQETATDFCKDEMMDASLYKSYYRASNMCWLYGNSLNFGFLLFLALVILYNLFVFGSILRSMFSMSRPQIIRSTKQRGIHDNAALTLTLTFTLGLGWIIGFIMIFVTDIQTNRILSWIFNAVNAFQGVYVTYIFCIRPKDVRRLWWVPFLAKISTKYAAEYNQSRRSTVQTILPMRVQQKDD